MRTSEEDVVVACRYIARSTRLALAHPHCATYHELERIHSPAGAARPARGEVSEWCDRAVLLLSGAHTSRYLSHAGCMSAGFNVACVCVGSVVGCDLCLGLCGSVRHPDPHLFGLCSYSVQIQFMFVRRIYRPIYGRSVAERRIARTPGRRSTGARFREETTHQGPIDAWPWRMGHGHGSTSTGGRRLEGASCDSTL